MSLRVKAVTVVSLQQALAILLSEIQTWWEYLVLVVERTLLL